MLAVAVAPTTQVTGVTKADSIILERVSCPKSAESNPERKIASVAEIPRKKPGI
jgi:hypothetical protein